MPDEYEQVRASSKRFTDHVRTLPGGEELMLTAGWKKLVRNLHLLIRR
jgi:hypothetical protein